jgi:hypothetical protein
MKKIFTALLFMVLLIVTSTCFAAPSEVTLAWDPPEVSTDVVGYKVYVGNKTGVYSTTTYDAGNILTYTFKNLPDGKYFFVVTAYNASGLQSPYSNEVTISIDTLPPSHPKTLKIINVKSTVVLPNGTITVINTTGQ